MVAADSMAVASTTTTQAPEKPEQSEQRKRVYSGTARLLVDSPSETRDSLSDLAEAWDGYVESVVGDTVTLRVPALRFEEFFELVLELGDVLHRSVETYDVTEQYQDLSTRLEVARQTRERLYVLLNKTNDVEQRLAILREIRRLTEEIERIGLTLELLERQISLSRITVTLVPRLAEDQQSRWNIPFGWIASLDPLYPTTGRLRGVPKPDLGLEFAVFDGETAFRAESPEGTRVRMGSISNDPRGDALFWQAALQHHLGPFYRSSQAVEWGGVPGVLMTSKDREPYTYYVGVVTRGRWLTVIEVFFPDAESKRARLSAVRDAIAALEVDRS
jgi:hypothetical protein